MVAAGVEIDYEFTGHSVIGLEVLRKLRFFAKAFRGLLSRAAAETPDVVIGVDYAGFNLRFASAVRAQANRNCGPFHNWRPRLVQYISPQVWGSRPGRARRMEQTHDLLLSILPFEPGWFAEHAPRLRVAFVGHPLVDRHHSVPQASAPKIPTVLLLPGSRAGELERHLPVMVPAAARILREAGTRIRLVLPNERLRPIAAPWLKTLPEAQVQIGGLDEALRDATLAIASTGTVTLECAWFGVPTIALYKTSRLTYQIGRRLVTVKHLAMPNLLAGETVIPEFVQDEATPEALAGAALELLRDEPRRGAISDRLLDLARTLGTPGVNDRAAREILALG